MTLNDILTSRPSWLADGKEADVVLSCRVRLARNIAGVTFPAQAGEHALHTVLEQAKGTLDDLKQALGRDFLWIDLAQLSSVDRLVLVEKHLISPLQAEHPEQRAAIVSDDGAISIMVNEEDHFRIQVMMPGVDLENVLQIADKVDDVLEERIDYAFDERYGYLTACPTNIGTALRATTMLHMPVLVLVRQVDNMAKAAAQVGLIVRGMYGEGSEVLGDIFQVSNHLAMGYSETELVEGMTSMVKRIAAQERQARKQLLENNRDGIEDLVWRSYGTLVNARLLENGEAMSFYSKVLLGINIGVLPLPREVIYELMIDTRTNHILKTTSRPGMDPNKDKLRAETVRERLLEVGLA